MVTVKYEKTINRPVSEVFGYLVDATNDPKWCPPVQEVTKIEGNGANIGTRYRIVSTPGPFTAKGTFELVDYQEDQRAEFKGSNTIGDFHYWYQVKPVKDGTRIQMTSKLDIKGWRRILTPIIQFASNKTADDEFENLKHILEGEEFNA